jgi:hypothetical protein
MGEDDTMSRDGEGLQKRERCRRFGSFVVAVYGDYGGGLAQLVKHPEFTHITRVKNQVAGRKNFGNGGRQGFPTFRHVRV